MMSASQYRDHAEQSSRMGERTHDAETAAAFERVAREWASLANLADAHDQLMRDLENIG
jgi:hypothetical protein